MRGDDEMEFRQACIDTLTRAEALEAVLHPRLGVVQAPLTAFVIVLEMTEDRAMVVPLMATALLAAGASRLICPHPLYHMLSRQFDSPRRSG